MAKALSPIVIDISHHNRVDPNHGFHDIKNAGIAGVIHKATEGFVMTDALYGERRERAKAVKVLWGSYHFGHDAGGADQADHYLAVAKPVKTDLVCLDWETPIKGAPPMTLAQAEQFVTRIHDKLGRWPVLYSGRAFLIEHSVPKASPLANCLLWIARYNDTLGPLPVPWKQWFLWQYTDGQVGPKPHGCDGVDGDVDRNYFAGDAAALAARWAA